MATTSMVRLPNGQNLVVTPVFGGLFFKSHEVTGAHSPFPAGWTIVLHSIGEFDDHGEVAHEEKDKDALPETEERRRRIHPYRHPTRENDHLFISSISYPNSQEYGPAYSPTRHIAMMLWATLYWYFHQPEPDLHITNDTTKHTPPSGRPQGEWRININREGIFQGKVILPKLERMGLISSEESFVGENLEGKEGWTEMFVSRRSFWQLDPRIYLSTLPSTLHGGHSPFQTGSPYNSRPSSPHPGHEREPPKEHQSGLWSPTAPGPFHSGSHLPTYYPPPPPQYTLTNTVRHPIRPKPPRQGEVFYTRYIPSFGQYISFRVASLSKTPVRHLGPVSLTHTPHHGPSPLSVSDSDSHVPTPSTPNPGMTDTEYLHKWMNTSRVAYFWGESGPLSHQESFLRRVLTSRHSFPVIASWDDKPFGYFEIYWVKEDPVARFLPHVGDYDRGFHCLVGEQEFRGAARVKVWLAALVHYLWLADIRTETVVLEPRVDNERLTQYCLDAGFYRERIVDMPHKRANILKIQRSTWEGPAL
ncbi:aerobactin siderophore biosynthesis protein iucB [Westerdykella ornata]|uniref:Aerobactin siderophore biosynthesis protein iucB n=1 Tax=Westerdykella ornata TaxID=318751 RepID=A0A6A6JJG0_WESOR|nr:aerobactin siderophore biosynthesis protein iucB [Westerdykella ornata]KAF2276627.1 aerobactin siderophore biosynthesis protein iucB [Westerdykella ornata]